MKIHLKKLFVVLTLFILLLFFVNNVSGGAMDKYIIENPLGINTSKLVDVDHPDGRGTGAILPRIYWFSMRQGFLFMFILTLVISLITIAIVIIFAQIITDLIVATFNVGHFKKIK